jgi:hypothetical protein
MMTWSTGHQVGMVDEGADAAAPTAGGKKGDKGKSSSTTTTTTKKIQCDCGVPRAPVMARHPLHPHPCRRVGMLLSPFSI